MKFQNITEETKKAWSNNWKEHSVDKVMEIFSYNRVQRLLKTFISILPKEGKILEGGCGLGPWVIKLTLLGYDMTGVDYDPVSIDKIRTVNSKIPLYVANVAEMPFKEETFDAYMSLGVLEHFCEGPEKAIKEAHRVLKDRGVFLVMLPYLNIFERINLPGKKIQKNKMIRRLLRKPEKIFYYERYFKKKVIHKLLEENGFIVEKILPVDHIFTFVSFSKFFRNKNTYDGENQLAIKVADFFKKIMPWQTAGSSLIVARKK